MHAKAVLNSDLSRMRGAAVCTNLSVTTVKKLRLAELGVNKHGLFWFLLVLLGN